jgi:hypothetical protein
MMQAEEKRLTGKIMVFYVPASYFSVIRDTIISNSESMIRCSIFVNFRHLTKGCSLKPSVRLFEVSLIVKTLGY